MIVVTNYIKEVLFSIWDDEGVDVEKFVKQRQSEEFGKEVEKWSFCN